jgi:hypothetical protein
MQIMKKLLFAATLLAFVGILIGCGGGRGGSKPTETGSAVLTITWPEPSRLIPSTTAYIEVQVLQGTRAVYPTPRRVDRPPAGQPQTSTVELTGLPAGDVRIEAKAFPGTGSVPLAEGAANININSVTPTPFGITMATTIKSIKISEGATTITSRQLRYDDPVTLTATPMNGENGTGAMVLIDTNNLRWTTSSTAVRLSTTGAPNGSSTVNGDTVTLRGAEISSGPIDINIYEAESGKSASLSVTVAGFRLGLLSNGISGNTSSTTTYDLDTYGEQAYVSLARDPGPNAQAQIWTPIIPPPTSPVEGYTYRVQSETRGIGFKRIAIDTDGSIYAVGGPANGDVNTDNEKFVRIGANEFESRDRFTEGTGVNFSNARALAVGDADNVYVLDYTGTTFTLYAFPKNGSSVRTINDPPIPERSQPLNRNMAVDSAGNIYVATWSSTEGVVTSGKVVKLDSRGTHVPFNMDGIVGRATDIDVDSGGFVYVLDALARKVYVFSGVPDTQGSAVKLAEADVPERNLLLTAVAVPRRGRIYVLDRASGTIPSMPPMQPWSFSNTVHVLELQ